MTEQPICIQFVFAFDRLKSLAHAKGIIEIIKATQSGMSTEQFSNIVAEWLATARDPRFGHLYTDLAYQPMLELLDYLRANEFKNFIVSGTGADFIRVFAEETYLALS
jgi:phosphoglycolate phosphatase-like HAD superfamily hydrolase